MRNNYFISGILILSIMFVRCNSKKDDNFYIDNFKLHEEVYENMVIYIKTNYIYTSDRSELNRKVILVCGQEKFSSSDYRFCDSSLVSKMKALHISAINIEKNVCYADKNFDLISFELSNNAYENKVYYQYSLCSEKRTIPFENKNVKIVPIKQKWSVFIERN